MLPPGTQCQGGEKARRGGQRGAAPRPGEWESPFDELPGQLPCMAQFEELPLVPVNSRCTEPPGAGEGPQLLQDFTTSASKFAHPWPKPTRLSALSFGVPPKGSFSGSCSPCSPQRLRDAPLRGMRGLEAHGHPDTSHALLGPRAQPWGMSVGRGDHPCSPQHCPHSGPACGGCTSFLGVVIKHTAGGLHNRNECSHNWEARSSKTRCQQSCPLGNLQGRPLPCPSLPLQQFLG